MKIIKVCHTCGNNNIRVDYGNYCNYCGKDSMISLADIKHNRVPIPANNDISKALLLQYN